MKARNTLAFAAGAALALPLFLWRRQRTPPPVNLSGQVALITGGSRGLGFILARDLARAGCRVVICARDADELARARRDLADEGADVLAIPCDVSDQRQVEQMVQQATETFGPIEILINNAGIIQVGPIQNATLDDFEQAMDTMFWGVFHPIWAVLPGMRARNRGRIVNVTSIGGKVSVPHLLPYCAAKFAAVGLSEGLRAELANSNVQVTTIVPGLMRTGSYLNALFRGRQHDEFTWFSLGSTLPFVSMDAERAAQQILAATKRGEAERILSLPAQLLARFHGLFPALTIRLVGRVATLLLPVPSPEPTALRHGHEVTAHLSQPRRRLLDLLTVLGQRAARQFHQY